MSQQHIATEVDNELASLRGELAIAQEQQAATSEILQIIISSGRMRPGADEMPTCAVFIPQPCTSSTLIPSLIDQNP